MGKKSTKVMLVVTDAASRAIKQTLGKSADGCTKRAVADLRAAALALESGEDNDIVDGHILDAQYALGERRGYLNAIVDLVGEG